MRGMPEEFRRLELVETSEQTVARILIAFDWVPSTAEYVEAVLPDFIDVPVVVTGFN